MPPIKSIPPPKVQGRRTNNSLSSLTENIFIPLPIVSVKTDPPTPPDKPNRTTDKASGRGHNHRPPQSPVVAESASTGKSASSPSPSQSPPAKKRKSKSSDVPHVAVNNKNTKSIAKNHITEPPPTKTASIIMSATNLSFTETEEVLQIGMHKVLEHVKNHNDAWPFVDPVEEDIAPRYYTIIRRPMDLLKMEEKLDSGEYQSFTDFRNDFKLIVNNCRLYNGQNNEYTEMVNNLQVAFEKATKKYFESNSSDDERNAEYPDLKTNVFREKNFNSKNVVTPKPALLNELAATKLNALNHEPTAASSLVPKKSSKSSDKADKPSSKSQVDRVETDVPTTTNTSRGTKRKRKDKEKRKKKKSKTSNSGRASEIEDDDEETVVVPTAAIAVRMPSEDEDEDAWEYDKPPKHIKKKKKNAASVKKTSVVKSKSKGQKDKKVEEEAVKEKESPSKRKQKINKKKEYSSEEEQVGEQVDEDEDRENRKRSLLSKKGINQTTKSPSKLAKTSEKVAKSLSKKDARDTTGSNKDQKQNKNIDSKPNKIPPESVCNADDLSLSSDDALFNFPMAISSNGTDKTQNNKKKPKTSSKTKHKNESTKSKGKVEPKNTEHTKDARDRSKSPILRHLQLPQPSSAESSRSNSPAVFTVDLHKKYSQSASNRTLITPTKSKPATDLMSVSSGSRNSSPAPSNASPCITAKAYPTNHERIKPNRRPQTSSSPLRSFPISPVHPSTPEIRNKYDLIKERRSRNHDNADKVKSSKDPVDKRKDNTTSTTDSVSRKLCPSITSGVPALSETIEKLKAKNKSTKQRSAMLSEILGGKKTSEARTEKEIWEKLSTDTSVKPPEPKKRKKETAKKDKTSTAALLPPPIVDEYNFVDDLLDQPNSLNPVPKTKEPPTTKLTKTGTAKKPRASKTMAAPSLPVAALVPKPTNLEALELETEQTLKDINRWLEHTPRFSDFNSASNSPSRYNLLDDFETVTANLDEEFQRPIVEPPTLPPVKEATIEIIGATEPSTSETNLPVFVSPTVPETVSIEATSLSNDTPIVLPKPSLASVTPVVPSSSSVVPAVTTPKTIQLIGMMPAPGSQKREAKEKKKSLKEKITGTTSKRKDVASASGSNNQKDTTGTTGGHHRGGIERLQPGKTKGNLMKTEDPDGGATGSTSTSATLASSVAAKLKEVKNSLMQPESDTGPKLSLGSVLNTEGFGLGMQHNFGDEDEAKEPVTSDDPISSVANDETTKNSDDMDLEEIITSTDMQQKELEKNLNSDKTTVATNATANSDKKDEKKKETVKSENKPTPNLNAWFKAFGAPKKSKKAEEEEAAAAIKKAAEDAAEAEAVNKSQQHSPQSAEETSNLITGFQLPAPRTSRKASTGSTMSERSSYSQDPDSPRMALDERLGGSSGIYPAPFPSPLSSSPLTSPKDDTPKTNVPLYPINGALKVGFYQDTITKSSPEKSCSPREQPPAYSMYAQHLYSSSAATSSIPGSTAYGTAGGIGCSYTTNNAVVDVQPPPATNQLGFNHSNKTPSYYDQYKQPRSQDSDYNSSMSPNPNSPYQQQLQSPYQQPGAASPYQHTQQTTPTQHSPFHQPQPDGASATSTGIANSPGFPGSNSPSFPKPNSPNFQAPNSPYHHQQPSPFAQPNSPAAQTGNVFSNQSPANDQPFSPSTGSPKDATNSNQQQSPFHSNPTSPFSPHQPNSPYQQQQPTPQTQNSPSDSSFTANGIQQPQQQHEPTTNALSVEKIGDSTTNILSPCANPQPSPVHTNPDPKAVLLNDDWQPQIPPMFDSRSPVAVPLDQVKPLEHEPPKSNTLHNTMQNLGSLSNPYDAHGMEQPVRNTIHHPNQFGDPKALPQQMLYPNPYAPLGDLKHQEHSPQPTHQQQNLMPSHHSQLSMSHLHPMPAHSPYMQTYSNPYLDRRQDGTSPIHHHNQGHHLPKHHFPQQSPQTGQPAQPSQPPLLTHPALQTPTLSLPSSYDDSNSSAGSMSKTKSLVGDKSADQHDIRSLETPRPQTQASGPPDGSLKPHQQQMFDNILGSLNGGKRDPTADISTSKAYDMFNRAAMGFGSTPPKTFGTLTNSTTNPSGTLSQHGMTTSTATVESSKTSASLELTKMASNHMSDMHHYPRPPTISLPPKVDNNMMNMGYTGSSPEPSTLKPSLDKALNMSSSSSNIGVSNASMYHQHHQMAPATVSSTASSVASHQNLHSQAHNQMLQHQQQQHHHHHLQQNHHQSHLQHQQPHHIQSTGSYGVASSATSSVAPKSAEPNPRLQQPHHQQQSHQQAPTQHNPPQSLHHSLATGHHQQSIGSDKLQPSPYELNVPRYDMSGRLMAPLTGLDPYKPFTPTSSVSSTAHPMLDAHTSSMRSLMNMDQNNPNVQQQQPSNNASLPYYPPPPVVPTNPSAKDMPPAAHMFNTKPSSSNQPSTTANLHQMLNNTMSLAYANREHQHHLMQHPSSQQPQSQQHPNPSNAYGQHIPDSAAPQPVPVVETKPKRTRKKKTPAAATAAQAPSPKTTVDARHNPIQQQQQQQPHQQPQQQYHQHLQQQQQQQQPQVSHQQHQLQTAHQGFQSYSHLKTNQTNNKASPNHLLAESSTTSLKSTTNTTANLPISTSNPSVPGMVPGSAFNFGPSGAGLGVLYGSPDGASSFMDDFRNTPNPYYIPPAHHRSTPDASSANSGTGDKSAAAAAAVAAAAVAATSAAAVAGAPTSYHQFLSHAATSRASPYGFMASAPSLDPNAQMYQSAQLRQMMLGQGILGHGAPAPYGYHPALGMHKSPYDPMGQMNRPPWYQ